MTGELPAFFRDGNVPAKVVRTAGGGVTAFRLGPDGGWTERPELARELVAGPAAGRLDREEFLTFVERERGRLSGTGPLFDLYARIAAAEEGSPTARALRRTSFILFETQLQQRGDPGADPSLATEGDDPRVRAAVSTAVLSARLEPILRALAADDAALRELRPREADYAWVFVRGTVALARRRYERAWDAGIGFRRPVGRPRVRIHLAPAGALVDDNALSRPFPGGYRSVARRLVPTRVWAAWRYHSPGATAGLSYDGLVWCDDHWAFFPKPYRVLTSG
ncbi:hypothetical protein [Amycolatopsis eburnea]|uniref:Uncharacterized protein n=1 Tax=Amycolatopsis eburnea TaxID=2267691 RepID=A0A3R9FS81_9PSEU|nr:hypothetical protein [Amycolatopsis eburnea]RSD22816.1 hypothetical protein EIY87_06575 [Amycolatopsis eburnea]